MINLIRKKVVTLILSIYSFIFKIEVTPSYPFFDDKVNWLYVKSFKFMLFIFGIRRNKEFATLKSSVRC